MIMTTRVRKPPIRLEELSDELLSPHQITGSVPFSDTAFSLYYWAALFWHPICLCPEDPKVNRLTTQYHFISRPFEIFFWRSLIGQWELFFPTILKMTASGRVHSKSHFSAHEWTSGIDFTLGGQHYWLIILFGTLSNIIDAKAHLTWHLLGSCYSLSHTTGAMYQASSLAGTTTHFWRPGGRRDWGTPPWVAATIATIPPQYYDYKRRTHFILIVFMRQGYLQLPN